MYIDFSIKKFCLIPKGQKSCCAVCSGLSTKI